MLRPKAFFINSKGAQHLDDGARATAVLIAVRGQLVALDQIGSEEGFVER